MQNQFFLDLKIFGGRRCCLLAMALLPLFVFSTCGTIHSKKGEMLVHSLSDFQFVGVGHAGESTPPHGMKGLPLPPELSAGNQYVFHLRRNGRDLDVYNLLLKRFRETGIQIRSADDSMHRYVGGPAFRIEFQASSVKGFIVNRLDAQIMNDETLLKDWMIDDYILVVEESDALG